MAERPSLVVLTLNWPPTRIIFMMGFFFLSVIAKSWCKVRKDQSVKPALDGGEELGT